MAFVDKRQIQKHRKKIIFKISSKNSYLKKFYEDKVRPSRNSLILIYFQSLTPVEPGPVVADNTAAQNV